MNNNFPLISVIIPVYNGENYLADAIESVLAQTYPAVEIIVVDDGSTDGSAGIIRQFSPPVRYCFQENRGLGAARNRGVSESRGDYLSFLDADDLWLPDKLSRQMEVFQTNPDLDMVFGRIEQFVSPELNRERGSGLERGREIVPGYSAITLLIKRNSFFQAGLFATGWRVGEFIDWYLKAQEAGLKSDMRKEVVARRRIHNDNMGIREQSFRGDYVRILKASLDRRRKIEMR